MAFCLNRSSFSDLSIDKRIEGVNSFLKEVDEVIDFNKLLPITKQNGIGTKNTCGNKAYDPLSMFKVLLLQKFYNLSDEAAELALLTNMLYFRFAGFSVEDPTPDASTIGKFRGSLIKAKLYEKLFKNVNKQLENQGLISKIRAKVEHPFGVIKFQMKYRSSKYIGLLRNHVNFVFLAIASNLKTLAHRRQKRKICSIA